MSRWKIVSEIKLKQVSYGSEPYIWGIDPDGKIYQFSEGNWNYVRGPEVNGVEQKCKWISVGIGGNVWCTIESSDGNIDDSIYRRIGIGDWQIIAGKIKQLSVAPGVVWGVNKDNNTFKFTQAGAWAMQTQKLKFVSVGSDGKVLGIAPDGGIKRLDGTSWTDISGTLVQISVGSANEIWGIDANGKIFKYSGNDLDPWTQIAGTIYKYSDGSWSEETANLTQISVGSDGTVWGVDRENQVLCNYYLKDSHLLVSAPKLDPGEERLEQGDEALFNFSVSNISSGANLTNISLRLVYDPFTNIEIYTQPDVDENQHYEFPTIAELGPGESSTLTFRIDAEQESVPDIYWLKAVEAEYTIVPHIQPSRPPIKGDLKGFMPFEVVHD
ncbi:MAG: tectonin domain-containing protein [Candidatus Odinarchaeota archaeon]